MRKLPVSLGEITREGTWALRALGYSYFIADRATRLVVWTEAVHQTGLKFLRIGNEQLRKLPKGGPLTTVDISDNSRLIDGGGRSILELGPPAIDLTTAASRKGGFGQSVIWNINGLCLADALSEIAVSRDLGVILIYRSGMSEIRGSQFSRSGWLASFRHGENLHTYSSSLNEKTGAYLQHLSETALDLDKGSVNKLLENLNLAKTEKAAEDGYLSISISPVDQNWPSDVNEEKQGLPEVDYTRRLKKAEKQGVMADHKDFLNLYSLERETWAPTSERSKKQAAF